MLPSDVNLVSITSAQRDKASAFEICRRLLDNGEIGDPYEFQGKPVSTVSGDCLKLDMSVPDDRIKYADLAAAAVANQESVIILWEERVKTENGGLIIYLCYLKTMRTTTGDIK